MNAGDYETVAAGLNEAWAQAHADLTPEAQFVARMILRDTAVSLANKFCATSDRFDPIRFLRDCGMGDFKSSEMPQRALQLRIAALRERRERQIRALQEAGRAQ